MFMGIRKRPWGVIIFGSILIITSVEQLWNIPGYPEYRIVNPGLPEGVLHLRYVVSYVLRIVGLASGVGVIFLSEFFRRILLGLSAFSIGTIFLRHTYGSFYLATQTAVLMNTKPGMTLWPIETLTWASLLARCVVDVAFALAVIYYFSRPGVRAHFCKWGQGAEGI